ncbi:hypothetical protein B0H14DRAFT_2610489 [Mycena olivaceomarginata]|nr:hypothetical protein B0H14DRAFT_2610489 [Mycena olivaceomarginata]
MGFSCSVPGCSKDYETQGGLTAHRKSCKPYHDFVARSVLESSGTQSPPPRRKRGRDSKKIAILRERKERTQGPELRRSPAPSSSHEMDIDLSQPDEGPLPMEGIENLPLQGPSRTLSEPPNAPSPVPQPVTASGRIKRNSRLPARFRDTLPQPLEGPPPADDSLEHDEPGPARRVTLFLRERFETAANGFRLFRSYLYRPTYDPDSLIALDDLSNRFTPPDPDPPPSNPTPAYPKGLNTSASMVVAWQNNGNTNKSDGEYSTKTSNLMT